MFTRPLKALALALALSLPAHGALNHDPSLAWKSLTSRHFVVHFHDGEQALAEETAAIAERVHQRLSQRLGWTPEQRTQLVLTDRYDFTNGWATFFPYNHVTLITQPPDDLFGLEDFDHWLDLLITHEYTHVLHLDKATRGPANLRNVFGRMPILFPAAFQPTWLLEGLATHVETDHQRGIGRGQSSYYRALMRMEVANGIKPLRQVNQPVVRWPGGQTPYLYGVYFYQFLEQRYGSEKARKLTDNYSLYLIPFMINTNSRQVLGKDLDALWAEFDAWLQQEFAGELAALRQPANPGAVPLSQSGYLTGNARTAPDGSVYYIQDNQTREDQLMQRRPGDSRARAIADVRGRQFDLHPEAGIVIAQIDRLRNSNLFSDLYRIDPRTGRSTRLTQGGRYRHAAWSPDGNQIIASQFALGRFSLHLLDAQGKHLQTLWQAEDNTILGPLDWSPTGERLVVSRWHDGQWDLAQFDLASQQWQALTQSREIEAQPQFDASGASVVFAADYDGVYNIYRLRLADQRLERLSHEGGAATQPALSHDGATLYYSALGREGFDLAQITLTAQPATAPAAHPATAPTWPDDAPVTTQLSDYNGLKNLTPTWWFPYWLSDKIRNEVGASTSGADPLYRHSYRLTAGYDSTNNWGTGSLFYLYDRWQPIFKLFASRLPQAYTYNDGTLNRFRFNDILLAELEYPILKYRRQFALHAGLAIDDEYDAKLAPTALPWPDVRDHIAGAAISYNSTRYYPQSIRASHGRQINLVGENSGWGDSDYDGSVQRLDWREVLGLGGKHSLSLRAGVGQGDSSTRPFKLGGHFYDSFAYPGTPYHQPLFNRRSFPLRGYGEGIRVGQNMALASAEWAFPIALVERGWMVPPIGVHQISGKLFFDAGNTWIGNDTPDRWLRGTGMELNTQLVLGYRMGLQLDIGYAKGLDLDRPSQVYLRLGVGI